MRKDTPITIVGLAVFIGSVIYMAIGIDNGFKIGNIKNQERRLLYQNTSENIANIDGRPGTSHEDWAIAYRKVLNRGYDVYKDNPQKLDDRELIEIHNFYQKEGGDKYPLE